MIKVSVNIPVGCDKDLNTAVGEKLKVKFHSLTVLKKSLDARRGKLSYNYTVAVETRDDRTALRNGGTSYERIDHSLDNLVKDIKYVGSRPIVVGSGPCGLFAALTLCQLGAKPIVIERGDRVEERRKKVDIFNSTLVLDTESNIQFGEGGAGTFSDGKLNTGVNSKFVPVVLEEFVRNGAPEEITYLNKPHVGTDILYDVVRNIRGRILSMGGEILFNTTVVDFIVENNECRGVVTDRGNIYSDRIYLCIGHSARDTFYTLYGKGIVMAPKVFSMGVRIEHLQSRINEAQYGKGEYKLPPADYKVAVPLSSGNQLYSFCMCPGGTVVNASSEEGLLCVNGMSNYARDGANANSALLVNVGEREYGEGTLAGVEYQRKIERLAYLSTGSYRAPVQTYEGLLKKKVTSLGEVKPSVPTGYAEADMNSFLPKFIVDGLVEGIPQIGKKIRGFDRFDSLLTGVEARSSSPVRILRDERCCSSVAGLYPLGEGAGYAGGITSAAADGIRGVISSLVD